MQIPVTVAFEGVPESDAVQRAVWRHAAALERHIIRITSCRVAVVRPHRRGWRGSLYRVRVDLTAPGQEIVVNREHRFDHAHEDVYVAMRDAFRAARRRLEEYSRRLRGRTASRAQPRRGRVSTLFPVEGYGFIKATDGREVYFHRHAVVPGGFGCMEVGNEVRFAEKPGEQGPHASAVHVSYSAVPGAAA